MNFSDGLVAGVRGTSGTLLVVLAGALRASATLTGGFFNWGLMDIGCFAGRCDNRGLMDYSFFGGCSFNWGLMDLSFNDGTSFDVGSGLGLGRLGALGVVR